MRSTTKNVIKCLDYKLCEPYIKLTAVIRNDNYGLDLEKFGVYKNNEQEVVFPTIKDTIKKIECLACEEDKDTTSKVKEVLDDLRSLLKEILILNDKNNSLTNRYKGDEICMRVHKQFRTRYEGQFTEVEIFDIISRIKMTMEDEVGHMADPTKPVIIRKMLGHVRNIYKDYGIKVNARMAEDIIKLFLEDKYKD